MSGKSCCRYLRANTAAGPADRHDEVRLGPIGEDGSDVVDNLSLWRADKPSRADDDLDDVHGCPGALVQFYTEVAGEVVDNQIAAVERLQHQDLSDRGLGFARRRTEHQQARQRGTSESATDAGHLTSCMSALAVARWRRAGMA